MNSWKKLLNVDVKYSELKYSDIVDRSDFRFADDTSKISRLAEADTGSYTGVYDYEGEVPSGNDDKVTALQVNLRQNLYNRGEIDDLHRAAIDTASSEAEKKLVEKASAESKKQSDRRNAAIDASLGISSE